MAWQISAICLQALASGGSLSSPPCQFTAMGLPESLTSAAVEAQASKFHHGVGEHLSYFRKDAPAAQGESDDE